MKTTIEQFKELTKVGDVIDIATSEYSIDPNPNTGWNPKFRMSHQSVKSMEKKGIVKADYFWRGCSVTRLI